MSRKSSAGFFAAGAVFLLLTLFLFAAGIASQSSGLMGSIFREVAAFCRDDSTQWMLVVCLLVYLGFFLLLESKTTPHPTFSPVAAEKGGIWLFVFVAICLAGYAWHYSAAVKSLQVLVLLAGIVFGKGMAAWVNFGQLTPDLFPNEAEREKKTNGLIFILLALMAGAACWQPETNPTFLYHGVPRWCGAWENPNLYGLLMGVGVVLGAGFGVRVMGNRVWRLGAGGKWVCVLLCLFAAILCGFGLFKSYSRGAWLGTAVGLGFLCWNSEVRFQKSEFSKSTILCDSCISWFNRNRRALAALFISVGVISFWLLRFSEFLPAQRLASVGNLNDFSWRNRVTAWQGAGRMLWDRPLTGFGWGEAEPAYGKDYCPTNESAAIEMNDYLMLGISAGAPAMVGFLVYVLLGLKRTKELGGTRGPTLICRAAAVVLLAGFWFDGGLFKLPVAAVFWTLLELGRVRHSVSVEDQPSVVGAQRSDSPHLSAKETNWLLGLAALLVVVAAGLTAIHLVTPRLKVSEQLLNVARKFLVPPNERKNFELLAEQPIWRGVKLKALLDHAELATYNRALVNWQVEDKMFQDFVLSPMITGEADEPLDWRRKNWEEFYPRVRHESSLEDAAKIVIKQLRERGGACNELDAHSVAALRSVGIPARLNSRHCAELWDGSNWRPAPSPPVASSKN